MSWRNFTLGDALDLERMLKLRQTKNVDQRGAMGCKDTSLKFLHLLTSPKDRKIGLCRSSMRHRRERIWGRRRFLSRNAAIKEKWSKRASERTSANSFSGSAEAIYLHHMSPSSSSSRAASLPATYPDYGSRAGTRRIAVHEGVHQQQQRP